jgi:hypothetical protein
MDISSTGFRMGRAQRMRMIGLAGLTRVCGGSLGRMIVQVFVFSVRYHFPYFPILAPFMK